ncbi:hypothetical protein D3C85_1774190 [compost metagenome]
MTMSAPASSVLSTSVGVKAPLAVTAWYRLAVAIMLGFSCGLTSSRAPAETDA